MNQNNVGLRVLIDMHNLRRKTVARMAFCSKSAVDRWLVPENIEDGEDVRPNPSFRAMPDSRMHLLNMGIEAMLEA